jgi:lysyl-tRNA synthetase class 2
MASGDRWLQTSPEYAMKRLLAAGSGPIYQICKAFREGESGSRHSPEFTLLEWYRPGYSLSQLIEEVAELVGGVLNRNDFERTTYAALFMEHLGVNPHQAEVLELETLARQHIDYSGVGETRDTWLDLLFTHLIEPRLAGRGMVFVGDFPATQAALARLRHVGGDQVAERFELYVDGMELANGYFELTHPGEQRARFERDNLQLESRGELPRKPDERLLAALDSGLPECAGVALGIDRLLMRQLGVAHLADVLSFDWSRS